MTDLCEGQCDGDNVVVGCPAELEGQSGQGERQEGGDQVDGVHHRQDQ